MVKTNKYESYTDSLLDFIKSHKTPLILILKNTNYDLCGYLEAITERSTSSAMTIKLLKEWREINQIYFPSQFKVTIKGTKLWAKKQLNEKKDRILFFVNDLEGHRIGHIGLYRFDYSKKSCEIDNVIRGVGNAPGIMTYALNKLVEWTYNELQTKSIFLTVFSDNKRAIQLYERCGFKVIKYIPLKKEVQGITVTWLEIKNSRKIKPDRQYAIMKHQKRS